MTLKQNHTQVNIGRVLNCSWPGLCASTMVVQVVPKNSRNVHRIAVFSEENTTIKTGFKNKHLTVLTFLDAQEDGQ